MRKNFKYETPEIIVNKFDIQTSTMVTYDENGNIKTDGGSEPEVDIPDIGSFSLNE